MTSNTHCCIYNWFSSTLRNPCHPRHVQVCGRVLSSQPRTILLLCPISSICCPSPFWRSIVSLSFLISAELEPVLRDDYTYSIRPATTDPFIPTIIGCTTPLWLVFPTNHQIWHGYHTFFPSTHIFPTLAGWGHQSSIGWFAGAIRTPVPIWIRLGLVLPCHTTPTTPNQPYCYLLLIAISFYFQIVFIGLQLPSRLIFVDRVRDRQSRSSTSLYSLPSFYFSPL